MPHLGPFICIWLCVCICLCACALVCVLTGVCVSVCACICLCAYVCLCLCAYVCVCGGVHSWASGCECMHVAMGTLQCVLVNRSTWLSSLNCLSTNKVTTMSHTFRDSDLRRRYTEITLLRKMLPVYLFVPHASLSNQIAHVSSLSNVETPMVTFYQRRWWFFTVPVI